MRPLTMQLHLDTCKDRVIEEVQKFRFNEPIPGWHGDIRNPTDFGSDSFARYTEHGAYDVRPPPGDAARPSRRKVLARSLSVPRGELTKWLAGLQNDYLGMGNICEGSLLMELS